MVRSRNRKCEVVGIPVVCLLCGILLAMSVADAFADDAEYDIQLDGTPSALAMSLDGSRLAIYSHVNSQGSVSVWDLKSGKGLRDKTAGTGNHQLLAFTTAGDLVADFGPRCRLLNAETLEQVGDEIDMKLLRQVGDIIAVEEKQKGAARVTRIYDLRNLTMLHDFGRISHAENRVQISPDATVAAAWNDNVLTVVDLATKTERPQLKIADDVDRFAISDKGKVIAVATDHASMYEIYKWPDRAALPKLSGRITPIESTLSRNSRGGGKDLRFLDETTIAFTEGSQVLVWDVETNKRLDIGPAFGSGSFDVRNMGGDMISLSNGAHPYDRKSRKLLPYIQPVYREKSSSKSEGIKFVHSAAGNRFAYISEKQTVAVRRPRQASEALTQISVVKPDPYPKQTKYPRIVLSDDGELACTVEKMSKYLGLIETATGAYTPTYIARPNAKSIADYDFGISGNDHDPPIFMLDSSKRQLRCLSVYPLRPSSKVVLNGWLAVTSGSSQISKETTKFQSLLSEGNVSEVSAVFRYDDKRFAVVVRARPWLPDGRADLTRMQLALLEIPSGKLIKMLDDNLENPTYRDEIIDRRNLQVSPNGQRAAMVSADRSIRVWDLRTFNEVKCLARMNDPQDHFAFALDGKLICVIKSVIGKQDTIEFTGLDEDQQRPVVTSGDDRSSRVGAIHPLHPRFLATSPVGRLEWRNLDDGSLISEPTPLTSELVSASFSNDGRTLATQAKDTTVTFWRVPDPTGAAPTAPPKVLTLAP